MARGDVLEIDVSRFPHTIRVDPSQQNGLSMPSVLLVFQLLAIDQVRVLGTSGQLEQVYLDQLDLEMMRILDLA